jgi:hypothetical protein
VSSLVYVYAVLPCAVAAELVGLGGQPVRWVTQHNLAAAVSDVPAEEFGEEPLNERIGDMSWLGPRAVAHQEVNSGLHERAEAIVPLAFGTVFRDDDRVRQLLRDQALLLNRRLETVRGCAEWVVALHLLKSPDVDNEASIVAARAEIESTSPGRAHLLRQRIAGLERDAARRLQADASEAVLANLRQSTVDVYTEPLPTDTVERPLLRASVLVRREAESGFLDDIERLRARWAEPTYRLLLTGPWPPYRFGGLTEEQS